MKLKSTTALSAAIASALYLNLGVAFAQDTAQDSASEYDNVLEEVVVTGIRGSLQRSLDAKRDADSHVDVISSEDIGKMPDRNIADSLQRVPGVTISAASANEGAFDENDRVSMRGTSASYTQTLINGHNIGSGDWFVLNQTGTVGRSVSYSLLPSELVDKVVVHKSYEAKQVEGGLTGSIDIITHRPLNFDEGMTFNGNVGAVYSDQPGDTDPQLSALFNWKNDDATVGLMVQAFYQERHLRRDGQEILGYNVIGPNDAAAIAYPELTGVFYPSLVGSALFEQQRERVGGQITLELAPTDDLTFVIDGFVSNLDAANYNRNYMLWGARTIQGGAVPDAGEKRSFPHPTSRNPELKGHHVTPLDTYEVNVRVPKEQVSVAALLPCFWIYWKVGCHLLEVARPDNPYQAWIDTYADEGFAEGVRKVIALSDRIAEATTPAVRDQMHQAFRRAAQLEWMFWDSAYRREAWPVS